ncbi:putative gpi-anchored cell wall beta- -endoglucanase protein [Phaeoacremonium minimum UCRPA7]|uniref:Probable glucan endo-1,3-beta-glucosidase eglC n=1 Tax=Phaeoacremonium minimum (strain UCR-PA7) TaxID=1286976 RepID=R8BBG1_PHAM7|nr:putative gpi-anchored cell wall beta- -endoglucanase protein [Phaeoacremonium minimum UCRPA7]EON96609.1 putative gpi-anchored cell wall beta- -endoglucanase protein [Phaeoacremonium minimum UCRPA7]
MYAKSSLVALAAAIAPALAAYQGFNYGSTDSSGAAKQQADFENEFKIAQGLIGAPGTFNSARLYTMVQGGTTNDPISAIPAAISTKTSLLLGLWASGGDAVFANELAALKSAISTYGSSLGSLVAGISVGSEDLYRITPTGIENGENPGLGPGPLTDYINQVKKLISGTSLADVPVGHVDTWNAWTNGSNSAVIEACDWLGVDEYPYFQNTQDNGIDNAKALFDDAYGAVTGVAGGKPVWVTETGWPTAGKSQNLATASVANSKTFWDEVGCPLFGTTNTWYYTLFDAPSSPTFGIVGDTLSTTPVFDLSCKAVSSSTSSAAPTTTKGSSGTGSGSGSSTTTAAVDSSASASASEAASTSDAPVESGSPGIGGGLPSSQLSLETSTIAATATGTGSGSGSTASVTSGSGSNSTISGTATPSASVISDNAGGATTVSLGAAFAAIMVAVLAL